jgi:hypothetical protein
MQLDRTRIAVRERNGVEVLDMALHVVRAYFKQILGATLLGALPFMVINAMLLWGLWRNPDEDFPWRYVWLMGMIVFIEAPWATAIVTTFLGSAVFDEQTSVRKASREHWKFWKQMLWCQGIIRGVLPALGLLWLSRQSAEVNWATDAVLLTMLALYIMALRAFRPFINEIILLERAPLRTKSKAGQIIPAGKRSKYLHDPSGGDLVVRWMGAALIGSLMAFALVQTIVVFTGMLFGYWNWGWFMLHFGYPLALWLTAGYMAVVRFLNYLDLRIRHEGWEVELRLRAEAVQLASKLT